MAQRALLYSGAARWVLAATLVVATGYAAISHVRRAAMRQIDAVTVVLGEGKSVLAGRLFESKAGLAIRLNDTERQALYRRLSAKPLDGTAFALAALDASAHGDGARAAKLIAHSIALEPRTRIAWLWRLDRQSRTGQSVDAAASALRLMAIDPGQSQIYLPILAALARDRRNIPQITTALRGNPNWRQPFLSLLQTEGFDPAIRFALMDSGNSYVFALDKEHGAFISDLIAKGDYDRAYLAWVSYLPDSALSGVDTPYDAQFKELPGAPPFNWQFNAADGDRAEANNGLDLSYSGRKPATLVSQVVVLDPGGYRLRSMIAQANSEGAPGSGTVLTWKADCLPGNRPIGELVLDTGIIGKPQRSAPFRVPDTNCPAVLLSLTGTAAEFPVRLNARITTVHFDRVALSAVAPAIAAPSPTLAIPSPQPSVAP